MAEMKNLKIEVVRYNPEVDTAPHSAFYEGLHQRQPGARPELPLVLPYGDLWFLRHDG